MSLAHPLRATSALALVATLLASTAALAAPQSLSGSVTYRERMALPPDAVLTVELRDVSLADAPALLLAETVIDPAGQVPVAYALDYDDDEILPGHRYALHARIIHGDRLLFITATHHGIFDETENPTEILLERVADPAPAEAPTGSWILDEMRGEAPIQDAPASFDIAEDGTVSGTGGCNRMMGRAEIDGSTVLFGQLASTMMACPDAMMAQEQGFFAVLSETRQWQIDAQEGRLRLLDEAGEVIAVLSRSG